METVRIIPAMPKENIKLGKGLSASVGFIFAVFTKRD